MRYEKPPLSFEQQADRLLQRGLIAEREELIRCLGTPIKIPRRRKHPEWHDPVEIAENPRRLFAILSVLAFLVHRIAPQSGWQKRLVGLWEEKHPTIRIDAMGFPPNWKESPVWTF